MCLMSMNIYGHCWVFKKFLPFYSSFSHIRYNFFSWINCSKEGDIKKNWLIGSAFLLLIGVIAAQYFWYGGGITNRAIADDNKIELERLKKLGRYSHVATFTFDGIRCIMVNSTYSDGGIGISCDWANTSK